MSELETTTKRLYDFTKEQSCRKTKALPELVTEGFDEEQIWQQLELQNESELIHFSKGISEVLMGNKKLVIPVSSTKPESIHIKDKSLQKENEDMSDDKKSEDEIEIKSILKKRKHDTKKKKRSSIVDDKFFKLQELDEYLTKEEKKEKRREDNAGSDDESVDLFNDLSEEEDKDNAQGKYLKYADFFDSPPSEDDQLGESRNSDYNNTENSEEEELDNGGEETDDDEESRSSNKKIRFNLTNDSDETDSLENKMHKDNRKEEDVALRSSFEARQERLQMRIKDLEEEAISEKPWQLKGEVSGPNRPQNSLLEEFVEFDMTTRPAPMITEETTMKLEDIIKQRIKDKAWDDVEKKFKPVETPLEYKKKLIMNQEKSKESLSQIYENAYLRQKQLLKTENEKLEEVPELHREIQSMMRSVMSKLDALSNYHYTPQQVRYVVTLKSISSHGYNVSLPFSNKNSPVS